MDGSNRCLPPRGRQRRRLLPVAAWAAGVVLGLCQLTVPASAAGFECAGADVPAERAVCRDDALRELDLQLNAAYQVRLRNMTAQQAQWRTSQRAWLKARDACGTDTACLAQRYRERLSALQYGADAVDRRALLQLQQAIEQRARQAPESALEQALQALAIERGMTTFSNAPGADDPEGHAVWPKRRPAGVTDDEWRALLRTRVEADAEHGRVSYMLLDVDGDGQRDLVVDAYVGGTGLFSYVYVLPRRGSRFAGEAGTDAMLWDVQSLYSLNGRGSHQFAYWVRLQGRVYAAWVNGQYGRDRVYLLNPLYPSGKVPNLSVRYAYELEVTARQPAAEGDAPLPLEPDERRALTQALTPFADGSLRGPWNGEAPLCPADAGGEEGVLDVSHYSIEVVGDVQVWLRGECRPGRFIDWFGSYGRDGLHAQFLTRPPGQNEARTYEVQGRRRLLKVVVEPDDALPG